MDFSTLHGPAVIGHRGASGHAAENSIAAFAIAADRAHPAHCDGVELDLHVTADGEFVVHHDPVLGTGDPISTLTLSRLRATAPAGEPPLPTLAAALAVLKDLDVFVEAKGLPPAADEALLAALRTHGIERCAVHAFDHRVIARLRAAASDVRLGVLSCSYPVDPLDQVGRAGATMLWQQAELIDEPLARRCHDTGVALIAWTVNDRTTAHRLTELGVSGLCGNWPERLRG